MMWRFASRASNRVFKPIRPMISSTSRAASTMWRGTRKDGKRLASPEFLSQQRMPAVTLELCARPDAPDESDAAVVFVTEESCNDAQLLDTALPTTAMTDFEGKAKTTRMIHLAEQVHGTRRVLVVGVGKKADVDANVLRAATHAAVARLRKAKLQTASLVLSPSLCDAVANSNEGGDAADIVARTAVLSNHTFDKYLSDDNATAVLKSLAIVTPQPDLQAVARAQALAECTVLARELANERGDVATPDYLEDIARRIADSHALKAYDVDSASLKQEGLHLLRAVGQGAKYEPRLVVVEYHGDPDNADTCTAVVGKGVTFDAGGLNIKPTGSIEDMHLDMGGAAATLGIIKAVASLRLKINLVACVALAENAVDANSLKPHTILHSAKGSVEVNNTDAEGRLCLADAFAYVQDRYKPKQLIDLATLTGACVVALGEYASGVFSNNDELAASLVAAGKRTHERCWHMPIFPEHRAELKGTYSDLRSTGSGRTGGSSTAAAFLEKFVDQGVEWAHIDIAGPGMYSKPRDHMPKGGTGSGVQLVFEMLEQQVLKAQGGQQRLVFDDNDDSDDDDDDDDSDDDEDIDEDDDGDEEAFSDDDSSDSDDR